jgi:hypothetical protein
VERNAEKRSGGAVVPQQIRPYRGSIWDKRSIDVTRWDEKAGLRRDAIGSQVIDVLEAQEIKETGNEED